MCGFQPQENLCHYWGSSWGSVNSSPHRHPPQKVDPLTLTSSLKLLHSLYSQPASSLLLHRKMNQLARSSLNCSLAAYAHPDDPSSCPWKRGGPGARDPIFAHFLEHLQFPTNMPTSHSCFKTNNILPISPAAPLTTLSFLLFVHFFLKIFLLRSISPHIIIHH